MGLNIAPSIWQNRINEVLGSIPNCREFCLGIMDDLLLFLKNTKEHNRHLEQVLSKLSEYGLKICPRKCHLFRDSVVYMGHKILIENGRITALHDKTRAIRNLPVPNTVRKVRSFVGAVNYLSMFVPQLQEHLKPFYELIRKRNNFK